MATTGGGPRGPGSSYTRAARTLTPRLPASARSRLDRFAASPSRTSYLSVGSAFGLAAIGFDTVGDVMGCLGSQISHAYVPSCGYRGTTARVVLASSSSSTWTSYVRRLTSAYATALDRLRAEAVALGADGVVDIRLSRAVHDDLHEVVAVGTAVRARSRTRPKRVFTTDLSGGDVAALLLGGWTPVALHAAVALGVRHDDWRTLGQTARTNQANVEVTGYTELLQQVRMATGTVLRRAVSGAGADGGLLAELHTTHWHKECGVRVNCSDHVALAVGIGTSVARLNSHPPRAAPAPLTVLPVTPARSVR